jgi:hypothetical protein
MTNTNTVIDAMPRGKEEAVPEIVFDEPTAKVALAMAETARSVERAFETARAQAIGAMFDAIVDDAISVGDITGPARATRVMNVVLERLKVSLGSHSFDKQEEQAKLYTVTPRS